MKKLLIVIILLASNYYFLVPSFAQDFTFEKARQDYIFSEDNYKQKLFDFNLKKGSYSKNPTLSLKDEFRISSLSFTSIRNILIKNYLTMLRIKVLESDGLNDSQKATIYSKIDTEVSWYENRKNNYQSENTLEDIIKKSNEEDLKYENETLPVIYYTLAYTSLGDSISIKNRHIKLYKELKSEADGLVNLGRADKSLFERWFNDIERELNLIANIESQTITEIEKIQGADKYQRESGYENSVEIIDPVKSNLLRLNGFVMELENVIESKR
jgi:hypothetical protein